MIKRILVAEEKHGSFRFDASTNELLDMACRQLLSQRLDEGYYTPYDEAQPLMEPIPVDGIENEQARSVIEDKNRQIAEANNKAMRANRRIYEDIQFYNDVVECLASDMRLTRRGFTWSWLLLFRRSDCEYEKVELIELDEPDEVERSKYIEMMQNPEFVLPPEARPKT